MSLAADVIAKITELTNEKRSQNPVDLLNSLTGHFEQSKSRTLDA